MNRGEVAERVRRSTVQIQRRGPRNEGMGSGFVWANDGRILTNAHVVDGGSALSVELWDGTVVVGEVQRSDAVRDLALVRIPVPVPPALELRSGPAAAGETVIAIGNPLGFTGAMTKGTVHRFGPVQRLGRRDWVQTAIRLAPGNSGGPLADSNGRVVGINSMVIGPGLALAIPAQAALRFAQSVAPPRLGVTIREVELDHGRSALLVLEVAAGSVAHQGSLLMGDIITSINGSPVEDFEDLAEQLAQSLKNPGGLARVQFLRGNRSRIREVVIALQPTVVRHAA